MSLTKTLVACLVLLTPVLAAAPTASAGAVEDVCKNSGVFVIISGSYDCRRCDSCSKICSNEGVVVYVFADYCTASGTGACILKTCVEVLPNPQREAPFFDILP